MKNNKGITLIALVITIIVLLILAGVAIAMISGENGILNRASESGEKTAIASAKEQIGLVASDAIADYYDEVYVQGNTVEGGIKGTVATAIGALNATEYDDITLDNSTVETAYTFTIKYNGDSDATLITGTISEKGKITWSDETE